MALKKKSSRRKGGTTVNFSGVESGGRRCPDGEYKATITEAEVVESSSGNPMIAAKWKVSAGKFKGVVMYDNISLVPAALWKLKTLLEVLGIDAQEDDVEASDYAQELIDQEATIIVRNETYEGEERPKVVGYGEGEGEEETEQDEGEAEAEEEEEEEDEPRVRNAKKKKTSKKDEDEEEEEEDAEEEESEEEEEEEEDEKPKKKVGGKVSSKIKEGSRVKFTDDDGNTIKGTVTSLDNGEATVEDKNGDEYELAAKHLTPL